MSVFTVDLNNQPGELARLCEAMAGRSVNLILCATTRGDGGTVAFIADDEAGAETVLADAGVNTDLLVPVRVSGDLFFAVICVDDPDKARRALGVQVISEDYFVL
ncbi:MAG: hypothetical protein ACRDN0_18825 [Trebonia sp.]